MTFAVFGSQPATITPKEHGVKCNRCDGTGTMKHECDKPHFGDQYYLRREQHPGNEALSQHFNGSYVEAQLQRCRVCGWYWLRFWINEPDNYIGTRHWEENRPWVPRDVCFGDARPADDADFLAIAKGGDTMTPMELVARCRKYLHDSTSGPFGKFIDSGYEAADFARKLCDAVESLVNERDAAMGWIKSAAFDIAKGSRVGAANEFGNDYCVVCRASVPSHYYWCRIGRILKEAETITGGSNDH